MSFDKKPKLSQIKAGLFLGVAAYSSSFHTSAETQLPDSSLKATEDRKTDVNQIANGSSIIVRANAQDLLKQQPGASLITSKDIEKDPPINDLSDIIRKMPGVNLSGNSASGARGNNRQIDIRGMGPENTLILIDGVPVSSRSSVRYSWTGERDTRGDTNWVPPEMVDHIDVLRGPAAAHYGSGAMGGVVNIVTKQPTDKWQGSLSAYTNQPEDKKEGATKRTDFSLSGPLVDNILMMRLYGSYNKTASDDADINKVQNGSNTAGHEGVRNKDINAELLWKISSAQFLTFDFGFSRQGNIYAGDTQYSNGKAALPSSLVGRETNRMYRQNFNLIHDGIWDWGQTKTILSIENTKNSRMNEGLTGGIEGSINSTKFSDSHYRTYRGSEEVNIPFHLGVENNLSLGAEWNREELHDPASYTTNVNNDVSINGVSGKASERSSKNSQSLSAAYIEDNIDLTDSTILIPGLRFDYSSTFGSNLSPSINISQDITDHLKLKSGIARVFKTPNLYQSSEGYLLYSSGNGCVGTGNGGRGGGCYLQGNRDLDPEISINKDIGIEYSDEDLSAGITYFRNDYKNKIIAGTDNISPVSTFEVYQWKNGGKAITQGLEGNISFPLVNNVLTWRTNATYMFTSKQKSNNQPLSLIPKYTLNHMLNWDVNDNLSTNINWTMYGKTPARTHSSKQNGPVKTTYSAVASYSILGWNLNYKLNKNISLNAGVNNILDKKIYRSSGGSTYNESGRSYYAGIKTSF